MTDKSKAEKAVKDKDLTLIPKCQRNEGWVRGAKLLEHWFSRKSFTFSNQNLDRPAEETIIKMKWVISKGTDHDAARAAYKKILNDSKANFQTLNSNKLLVKRLESDATLNLRSMHIGDKKPFNHFSKSSAADQHKKHIQTIGVSGSWSGSPMTAALANFNFHLLAKGEVEIASANQVKVTITGVGIYVRDGFDFTGIQRLGCWDFHDMKYFGSTNFWGKDHVLCVDNSSFRDWRKKNGKGGDFRVFSDIEPRRVIKPHTFTLPSSLTFKPKPAPKKGTP